MTDKLCTPENCKRVVELVDIAVADPIQFFKCAHMAPELIREALAREGLSVYQNYDRPMLELLEIGGGDTVVFFDKNWNDTDPTFRHRLFAATVEYLEGRK